MSEHVVRALEGIDGSGKTDSGKIIASEVGGRYFYFSDGNPLIHMRSRFDNLPTLSRFLFYIAMPMLNYQRIENMRENSDVFVDRTIYSTIAYHLAYGLNPKWKKAIPSKLLKQFDGGMVYFTVSEEERRKRLGLRYANNGIMTVSDQKSLQLGPVLDREYRKLFDERTVEIVTDGKTQQEVASEAIERLYAKR